MCEYHRLAARARSAPSPCLSLSPALSLCARAPSLKKYFPLYHKILFYIHIRLYIVHFIIYKDILKTSQFLSLVD